MKHLLIIALLLATTLPSFAGYNPKTLSVSANPEVIPQGYKGGVVLTAKFPDVSGDYTEVRFEMANQEQAKWAVPEPDGTVSDPFDLSGQAVGWVSGRATIGEAAPAQCNVAVVSMTLSADSHIPVNDGDADNDRFPGFADGFNQFGGSSIRDTTQMPSLRLTLRKPAGFELADRKLAFAYSTSDPAGTTSEGGIPKQYYIPTAGLLRLWKAADPGQRNRASVANGGNWVPTQGILATLIFGADSRAKAEITATLLMEGIRPGTDNVKSALELNTRGTLTSVSQEVQVNIVKADLDVDSDNQRGIEASEFNYEDQIEDYQDSQDAAKFPGKYVGVNDGDVDNDGVPNWADGFASRDEDNSGAKAGGVFTELKLTVPLPVDLYMARLRFDYASSDPYEVRKINGVYTLPTAGKLRLWTKDGKYSRSAKSIAEQGGQFVAANTAACPSYTAAQLGLSSGTRTVSLYAEGIGSNDKLADQQITVTLDPDGDGPAGWVHVDSLRLTMVKVDARVDSDNTLTVETPENPDGFQDRIEDADGKQSCPGKILFADDGDFDGDGIVEYCDGMNLHPGETVDDDIGSWNGRELSFVPLVVELPVPLDLAKLRLRFIYNASDPGAGRVRGSSADGFRCTIPDSGNIRVWSKNADEPRDPKSVRKGGHWVKPEVYPNESLAALGFSSGTRTVTFWLEGVRPADSERLTVEVDPDGSGGPADWVHLDAVRVKIASLDTDVDANRDGSVTDTDADDIDEDIWGRAKGAIVLVNCDDDNSGGFADRDSLSIGTVDGVQDRDDLATEMVRRIPLPQSPASARLRLRLEAPRGVSDDPLTANAEDRLRVFQQDGTTFTHVLGHDLPAEHEYSGADLDAFRTADVTMRLEGLLHAAQVDVVLEYGAGTKCMGVDRVRVMTAPLLFLSNIETAEKVYVAPAGNPGDDLTVRLSATLGAAMVRTANVPDQWEQDEWQFGFSSMPLNATTPAVLPTVLGLARGRPLRAWGRTNFPGPVPFQNLPHPNVGGSGDTPYGMWEIAGATDDPASGGNLEVTPPVPDKDWPFGRIVVGSNMAGANADQVALLASQRLQAKHTGGNNYELLTMNVNWLDVGHVDEIHGYVPNGNSFAVLVADPKRAFEMLARAPAERAVFYAPNARERSGRVTAATPTTITVDVVDPGAAANSYVRIRAGTGQGQVAHVAGWTGNVIAIDEVWELPTVATVYAAVYAGPPSDPTWSTQPDASSMFTWVSDCKLWTRGPTEFPALMTAGELLADTAVADLNYAASGDWETDQCIQKSIWIDAQGPYEALRSGLFPRISRRMKRIPIIFMARTPVPGGPAGSFDRADALTPNMVNLQVAKTVQDYCFVGIPFGPRRNVADDTTDVWRADVERTLTRLGCTAVWVDSWDRYHRRKGGTHCGSNVRLTPPETGDRRFRTWWELWPKK